MTSLCIVYAGWDPNWFKAFLGVMLLLAVMVNLYVKKLSTAERWADMTDTLAEHADPTLHKGEPLIQMTDVGKTYGAIRALKGINLTVQRRRGHLRPRRQRRRQVHPDQDHGRPAPAQRGQHESRRQGGHFSSPRESLDHGIATVYQDLAVVSLMEVWRNFFLGSEMASSKCPFAGLRSRR